MIATPSFSTQSAAVTNQNNADPVPDHDKVIEDLAWKQRYLTIIFREWVANAAEMDVDIDKQLQKMASVIRDQPELNHRLQLEVWLQYETTMLNVITSQIIRKMAKTQIKRTAQAARHMPELAKQIGLINQCEKFLMKHLPGKLPQIVQVDTAIEKYQAICHELERMKEKVLSKVKIPEKPSM